MDVEFTPEPNKQISIDHNGNATAYGIVLQPTFFEALASRADNGVLFIARRYPQGLVFEEATSSFIWPSPRVQ